MKQDIKYFFDSISSNAYWSYIFFTKTGIESIFSIYGICYLIIESMDFFGVYKKEQYATFAFIIFLLISIFISILVRRPIKSIIVTSPNKDFNIEVKIADIFELTGAIVISTNTEFEIDVAGGKISPASLQGQFTAKYFTGNQNELLKIIKTKLRAYKKSKGKNYPYGTIVPIMTHGKMFYFTAMAEFNSNGNAFTSIDNIKLTLQNLWKYVKDSGELQELVIPLIGTGRGRLQVSRKRMISLISDSFIKASEISKFTEKLVIVVRPEDANNFGVNLYDIKDNLNHLLSS